MSANASLGAARQAREIAPVETILADINRHAMPAAAREALDGQVMQRPGAEHRADLRRIFVWPPAWRVAFIVREKGTAAARERWYWISERELRSLASQGGAVFVEGDEA